MKIIDLVSKEIRQKQRFNQYFKKQALHDLFWSEKKLDIISIFINSEFSHKSSEWRTSYLICKYPEYIFLKKKAHEDAYRLSSEKIIKFRLGYIFNRIFCKDIQYYIKDFIINPT